MDRNDKIREAWDEFWPVASPAGRVDKNKSKYADLQAVEEYSWSGPSIPRYGGALPPKLGVG